MELKGLLKIEDVEGIEVNPDSSPLEILIQVAKVAAAKIYEPDPPVEREKLLRREKLLLLRREKLLKRPILVEEDNELAAKGQNKKRKTTTTKKKGQNAGGNEGPEPPPDMPQELKDYIQSQLNGSDFRLVIQKSLHKTDLSDGHNRLSVPAKKVMTDFLTDDEKNFFNQTEKDHASKGTKLMGIKVKLLEPKGEECELPFKRWTLKKADEKKNSFTYVFIEKWKEIYERNELKEGMILQVWSFRRARTELSFALVVV